MGNMGISQNMTLALNLANTISRYFQKMRNHGKNGAALISRSIPFLSESSFYFLTLPSIDSSRLSSSVDLSPNFHFHSLDPPLNLQLFFHFYFKYTTFLSFSLPQVF